MSFNDEVLGSGSGVIAKNPLGKYYIVTALHNVSGRTPGQNTPIRKDGGIPNRICVEGSSVAFEIDLYDGANDPNEDHPVFLTHRDGSSIDITLLEVPSGVRPLYPLDSSFMVPRLNQSLPLSVGQTCYILGFPDGLIHRPLPNTVFPIWKTGHIASEPKFDFDGQPKLLIDATTRKGMSGGMVVVATGVLNRLVGIYSGRYKQAAYADTYEENPYFTSELGWVYRAELINELLAGGN